MSLRDSLSALPLAVLFAAVFTVACGGTVDGRLEAEDGADSDGMELLATASSNIEAVTASAEDARFPASKAVDGKLSTRWSTRDANAWIRADLGAARDLASFEVAWYQGAKRAYTFQISTSLDGKTFTPAWSGTSSRRTSNLEPYTFPEVSARFVQVTVARNTADSGAHISELRAPAAPAPTPTTPDDTSGGSTDGSTTCGTLSAASINAVTASADDGNVPANVLDNDPDTRWSCNGLGCWIQADLGSSQLVGAVSTAWYRGDTRQNTYEISLSSNNLDFTRVASGKSALTTALQRTTFTPASGRYVRVTVLGNTDNQWASITELRAETTPCQDPNAPTEPTPTEPTPTEPTPTEPTPTEPTPTEPTPTEPTPTEPTPTPTEPTPSGTEDAFGIPMLYPTKAGGEAWSMGANPSNDPRFNPQNTITQNADGSWKMKSSQVRMSVYTSTGYSSSKIATYNRDVLANQGYMQAPNDWKNVEMTGFVKVNAVSDASDNFAWYARGGRHTDSLACEGSSYKGGLHYDGRTRWAKESWHVSYDQGSYKTSTSALKGRWVGLKAVMRNITVNNAPAVKLELWLNASGDKVTWVKANEMIDSGSWGGDASHCGGSVDAMPITWGGPTATFRWDSASDVDFKWLSVREIQ